jgi:hypothetical protein
MPAYRDKDPLDQRRRYSTLQSTLWTERTSGFDQHWRDLAEYLLPRRTRFTVSDRNKGEKDRSNKTIIDSTGRFAARTLASGLHAGLTSPARPWMQLTVPDPGMQRYQPVQVWLHDVAQRMLTVFATSNLYNVLPLVYLDMGVFGTGAMGLLEDQHDVFRAYPYALGSYAFGLDARGMITTWVRVVELTVRQLVEQFGVARNGRDIDWSHISRRVHDQWDRGNYEAPVQVTWIIAPNERTRGDRLEAKYLPWASCHFETESNDPPFLRESGFREFPIMAPRWDITGEDTYGTDCPGMTALGDVRQLQNMQKEKGKLLAKAVMPPLKGPSALRGRHPSLLPGDMTYVDVREGTQGLAPIHEVRLEGFQHISADIAQVQYRIQRAFFEDLFLMLTRGDEARDSGAPITAREVDERHEEKLLALGPVLERTNDELLDPLVDRVFAMMDRAHLLPPPPPELHGVRLGTEYISILAQAQKMVGVATHDRLMNSVLPTVQVFPEMRHKIDPFALVDTYAEMLGVDPRIIIATDVAQQSLAQERRMQAAQVATEQAATAAKAAKDASQTPMTGDTALARVMQAAQAQQPAGTPPAM